MHVQMSCFARHPAFLLLGLLTVLAMGQVQPASAEPCITCRTPDCPKKAGIVAWCGPGRDPKHKARFGKSATEQPRQSADKPEKARLASPNSSAHIQPDAAAAEPSLPIDSAIAAGIELPTAATTSPAPPNQAPERVDSLASPPVEKQPPMSATSAVTMQEFGRSEDASSRRRKQAWIAAGVSTGAGLAITTTVLAIVLTSLPSRCGPPIGTISLNECN